MCVDMASIWRQTLTDGSKYTHRYHMLCTVIPRDSSEACSAKPKSITFTFSGSCRWSTTMMLSGFRSQCTIPKLFRNCSAVVS